MGEITRRNALALAAAAGPLMLLDGPRNAWSADGDLPMIVLAPPGGATHLPLLIKAKEFDKTSGLNVQLKPRNELAAYFNDFAAKVEPVHQGGAASVFGNMRVRGVPAVITQSSCVLQILLIVPENSAIKSTADLKGKRLAIDRAGFHYGWMRRVARQAGLDLEKDVTLVPASLPATAPLLVNGDVDAAALPTGFFDALAVRNPGKFKPLYAIDDELARAIGVKQIYTLVAVHQDFATANPQLLKTMFEVWSAAAGWANANMGEAIELLSRPVAAGGTGLPKPVLQSQLVTHRTLRFEITKAVDIRDELFKEFQAYVDVGALPRLPDPGIIYTGL
jgi:ABC-type nitrate/sulfonate/bicarbonate transport system substrate-binding protein